MDKIKSKTNCRSIKKKVTNKSVNKSNNKKANEKKDKKIEMNKKQMYSTSSSQTMLKDMKNSAISGINSGISGFRTTFDNLTNKFKLASNGSQEYLKDGQSYCNLNAIQTPVQLYSPFGIESPSPRVDRKPAKRTCCRQVFFSPTQKIKEDVLYLNNGIKQLNLLSQDIENRLSPSEANGHHIDYDCYNSLI